MCKLSPYLVLVFFLSLTYSCKDQSEKPEIQEIESKVVLITLDGLRWQELFSGADPKLITHTDYVADTSALKTAFWHDDPQARRKMLMPFVWTTLVKEGQLYGNRVLHNHVDLTNNQWFSYPGYSEILCGFADDDRINSNEKINNKNMTVLEYIHQLPEFQGKVAAFASWDVFPYIINEERSGIPVNAGYEPLENAHSPEEKLINTLQKQTPKWWSSVRLDAFTHHFALEHLKNSRSRVLYIAYGETDDFAHEGHYDEYLWAAKRTDAMMAELWQYLQSDPYYKDQTTLIITTDHGRGVEPLDQWQHHGQSSIPRSNEVWLAVLGHQVEAKGEIKKIQNLYTNQIARTIAELLGVPYEEKKAGESLMNIFK